MVRAGAGPVRERWLDALRAALGDRPWRRLPPGTGDARLIGGLDLPATLAAGRPVTARGLLAEADGGVVVVPMAERLDPGTAARLAAVLDTGAVALERDGLAARHPARIGLVLLDEGGPDEAVPEALADRIAFRIDLNGIGLGDLGDGRSLEAGHAQDRAPSTCLPAPSQSPPHPEGVGWDDAGPGGSPLSRTGEGACHASHPEPEPGCATHPDPAADPAADPVAALCTAAAALGIASPRAPLLALRVARAVAGAPSDLRPHPEVPRQRPRRRPPGIAEASGDLLRGCFAAPQDEVEGWDRPGIPRGLSAVPGDAPGTAALTEAARLVLAHRATCLPAPEQAPQDVPDDAPEPESAETPEAPEDPGHASEPPDDVVLAAARAAIPPDLLARLAAGTPVSGPRAGRFGAAKADPRGGRPAGARPGDPRRGRLDLVATLRAAIPWQRLRQGAHPSARPIRIRAEALRIRRLVRAPEPTTIFCVDASGSAARERLAEAKGAVELMLGEAYARRDRVALVAFRGAGAELVLPPTRALARARRDLAGLPGGGGTPLAAGLDAAAALATQIRRGGGRPVVVVLTDGRANVARSGAGGRAQAGAEAESAARGLRGLGIPVLVLDTGARGEGARALAQAAGALYRALPQADPETLREAARTLHP
ncbi:Magnesium-chelatase 60 kDa subunit [Methylobacterium dankookense]|uniref:Magnesium-chelatase 60 kDa subunit n=1 Tax=Methylobacterium dankookense TaxID=560405 RepID=A0A564FYT2_9HYPH|nr:VWA domain-containing protein [Methylobacterium dankookense]VUF13137.1 Magnesium-chelatase 60 kDa subunit [Methylobacterium dankookense]